MEQLLECTNFFAPNIKIFYKATLLDLIQYGKIFLTSFPVVIVVEN